MNRSARRILIGVGAVLALLVLLLLLVPVLFAGKISDRVKTQLNRTLLAKVDWRGAGLGFFHDFPNLTLTLDDFTIVGVNKFAGDTLAAIPRFRVVVNLAGGQRTFRDADGHFSFALWKQRVDRFRGIDFSSYVDDGTVIAHYLVDEPNDPANWSGVPISGATLDQMAQYSKQLWPKMATVVRAYPD